MDRPDLPLLSLLLANAVTIALALLQDWPLGTVLAVYWFQSVTIGLFTFVRLLGVPAGGDMRERGKSLVLAGFFAVHYGLFHLVYLVFLVTFALTGTYGIGDPLGLAAGCAVFFANHLVSFLWYRPREEAPPEAIFSEPYARIVPMHLTLIFGVFVTAMVPGATGMRLVLLLFLLLKTGADVAAHLKKHARAAPAPVPGATAA
ncbi:MAG: DUF6498-containing protein [Methanospirillum sp.]